ncbi:MAG: PAS domain-containing protein [Limimaricola sp.]|uniref:PAS-domain containing protein n=1 Tax=Limimaricola sp. TaxID=2211665 RepID=UPI001D1C13F5|nr:PAS-domain containing protein [Limimaricola sp.]MBI1417239.1 PAS domain-containing protein [Limimaricola sp.]
MPEQNIFELLFVTAVATIGTSFVLALLALWQGRGRQTARMLMREAEDSIVFLFDDTDLVDATPAARALLPRKTGRQTDWDVFLSVFSHHFPDIAAKLSSLAGAGQMVLTAPILGGPSLDAEFWDGFARLRLREGEATDMAPVIDRITLAAMEDELETLRGLSTDSPQLIWKQDPAGIVTWANQAYLDLADSCDVRSSDSSPAWPPKTLFKGLPIPVEDRGRQVMRASLHLPDEREPLVYDITSLRRGMHSVHFGIDVTAIARAEITQRGYVQTMAQTFAQLSVGLAIFDRGQRLMTFNPALVELTGLPASFLSSRPSIQMVLDRLREARMLPEPKDYATWREAVSALEAEAQQGSYCETWNLPNGQTFSVTGRPHPDGALAFLFEDITAEVSLTRRFRAEIEIERSALDFMTEAVAVFSPLGTLILRNAAYGQLWYLDEDESLDETDLQGQARLWQDRCAPSPLWSGLQDVLGAMRPQEGHDGTLCLTDGRQVEYRFAGLTGGGTVVAFRPLRSDTATLAPPKDHDRTLRVGT